MRLGGACSPRVSWCGRERARAALTPSTPGTASEPESPHIWLQLAPVCFQLCAQTTTLAAMPGTPGLLRARPGRGASGGSPGPRVRSGRPAAGPPLFLLVLVGGKGLGGGKCASIIISAVYCFSGRYKLRPGEPGPAPPPRPAAETSGSDAFDTTDLV